MFLHVLAACGIALVGANPHWLPLPKQAPLRIHTSAGDALVTLEPNKPPLCWNTIVITWKDKKGSRELLRDGDESVTTAYAFRSNGMDLIFTHSQQMSASAEWTYSRLYWLRSGGELREIDIEPRISCGNYELPPLGEPVGYGGYFFSGRGVYFRATASPNTPAMAFLKAGLHLKRSGGTYRLAISSCRVRH